MEEPAVYLPSCVIRNKLVKLSEPQKKDNDKMVLTEHFTLGNSTVYSGDRELLETK